ncbi:hypothetical protein [Stackebrandtia nassauensis]|uniref:Uncharacterized protein n=1 Tax=Stackebrandtia nassauensis (strain DSM 44728 / CIP 108903 / NRRL B-16338 / NBRC 102104 / LLR-40K-21) TaxID=446470 RepID=D3PUA9_STANL|nr:hypothetical protein [Stackebrandtia nassauensis]ADD41055.1 hypothetical protein Snas_1347 [Stackebrandtia nassauensis DSM 44728]
MNIDVPSRCPHDVDSDPVAPPPESRQWDVSFAATAGLGGAIADPATPPEPEAD